MENKIVATQENGSAQTTFARKDIHQKVTYTIIGQLEKSVVPWQRPWKCDSPMLSLPKNFCTGNRYNGANIVLLWSAALERNFRSNEWASFKQWQEKKECIRKGEKGTMIFYTDTFEKEDEEGEIREIPFLKSSVVFNRYQLVSYHEEKKEPYFETPLVEKIYLVEEFFANTGAIVDYIGSEAFYDLIGDVIYMPRPDKFIAMATCTATEGYYSTRMHELTHWTGAKHRLNWPLLNKFGTKEYAQEELTAESGAAFLCAEFDISTADKGNYAA